MATSTSSSSASQSQNAGSSFQTFLQSNIPVPGKLDLRGNLAVNWKTFRRIWESYEIATHLNKQGSSLRVATLLSCIGSDVLDIFDGLSFDTEADRQDITKVLEKLEAYCIGETNETYERYVFNTRDQQQGESFDSYLSALRSLIKTCGNFGTLQDNLIRDRVVQGIRENSTRKKLLAESKLTLEKCISICRADETTSKQLKEIASEEVNAIISARRPSHSTGNPPSKRTAATGVPRNKGSGPGQRRESQIKCKFCLKTHEKKKESCFAWNKSCNACRISNHFSGSSVCRGKKKTGSGVVHTVEEFSDEDDYFFHIESPNTVHRKIFASPLDNYQQVFHDPSLSRLQPTNKTLRMFNQTELKPLGTVKIETLNPKTEEVIFLEYVVVNEGHTAILGAQAIQHFQLMSVNSDNIMSVAGAPSVPPAQPNLIREFDDVFQGEGLLQEKLHLEVDKTVNPVVLPVRKVPFALKEPLKRELDRLVAKGILVPVEVPTDWVSSMVVASKRNGKIRLCIDPKPLNKALKRNRYPLPTIDDLLAKLTNAKVFTVADAKNGFGTYHWMTRAAI